MNGVPNIMHLCICKCIYMYIYTHVYVNGVPTHNACIYIHVYIHIYIEISYVGPIVTYIMYIYINLLHVCSGGIPRSIHIVIEIHIYRYIHIHTYMDIVVHNIRWVCVYI